MRLLHTGILLLTAVLLVLPGCNPFRRSRTPQVPPAPAPSEVESPSGTKGESETPKQLELPEPPQIEQPSPTSIPALPIEAEPAEVPPPMQQPSRPPSTTPPKPESEQEVVTETPILAPQIRQLLTPLQEQQYNQEIDESLKSVQASLAILSERSLDKDQSEALERIHAFLQQTLETRRVDLVTARSLAQRADLLAQDLERTTR